MPPPSKREAPPPAAVALAYRDNEAAPTVLAKGRGELAERIIEKARAAGIYVHQSPELVRLLLEVDLDAQIPPALYRAVAEVLAWLYRIERGMAEGEPPVARGLPQTLRGEPPAGEGA
ncbi:MAG: flagellar protein [Rhodocyclaceae bacterium]|nr:flagellar protein [Rhodocyclaceae bacterium]